MNIQRLENLQTEIMTRPMEGSADDCVKLAQAVDATICEVINLGRDIDCLIDQLKNGETTTVRVTTYG